MSSNFKNLYTSNNPPLQASLIRGSKIESIHKIHAELNKILKREKRINLYKDCLKFLKTRVDLDLALFKDDIWSH